MTAGVHEETRAIRESMLSLCGTRYPRSAGTLFGALRDEWGQLGERRLWRALQWLETRGLVRRIGRKWGSDGYVRVAETVAIAATRPACSTCSGHGHNSATCDNLERRAA